MFLDEGENEIMRLSYISDTILSAVNPLRKSFPGGSDGKVSAYNTGDPGSIPGLGRSPGEEMATHSSIPAWRIPGTEEPGRLQSMGSQRVARDTTERPLLQQLLFGEGNGTPFQYSCLENPMDGGAW